LNLKAVVHPFLQEMEQALAAATVAVSRAGASSLAELAALRLPAVLIPYPQAADAHQWHNANAFAETGAAYLFEQTTAPERLGPLLGDLVDNAPTRDKMQNALAGWYTPQAAPRIAEIILAEIKRVPAPKVERGPLGNEPVKLGAIT
jgi:UDP-N-acetylglucosamine--N-acetylmuramyl-(pentapeptide) pyrophosphoryl-undecaprenol N-acetylglucosamine transferase